MRHSSVPMMRTLESSFIFPQSNNDREEKMITFVSDETNNAVLTYEIEVVYFVAPAWSLFYWSSHDPKWANFIYTWNPIQSQDNICFMDTRSWKSTIGVNFDLNDVRLIESFAADGWKVYQNEILVAYYNVSNNVNEVLSGLGGDDELQGRGGRDILDGGTGDDIMWGGTEDDTLIGGDGDDVLFGNNDNDALDGGAGVDYLFGGEGDDDLIGGEGADFLIGGAGDDRVSYETSLTGVKVDLGSIVGLRDFSARYGDAEGDYFESIRSLAGSQGDD
ncbi:MAG: calcium-binding protein, partial [Rhizobiaceae bacterium]